MADNQSGDSIPHLFATATRLHGQGDLQRAEYLYREIIRRKPDHAEALGLLGVLACQAGQVKAGIDLLQRALRLKPRDPDLCNNLGMALLQAGDEAAAEKVLRKAVKNRAGFAEAHFNLASACIRLGDVKTAEQQLNQALRARPDYPEAWNNLGNLLREQGRPAEAVPLLRRVVERKPELVQARLSLALSCEAAGDALAAKKAYEGAVAVHPSDPKLHFTLGNFLRRRGALAQAEAAFTQGIEAGGRAAESLSALGAIQFAQNDIEQARANFVSALELAPDAAPLLAQLGCCAAALGDREEAESFFEKAVKKEQTCVDAWRGLAELPRSEDSLLRLRERLEQVSPALTPESQEQATLDFALGRTCDRLGDFEAAFASFQHGNKIRKRQTRFDAEAQSDFVERLIQVFSREFFAALPAAEQSVGPRPVLVVGMPRSGTTLVEQILAAHPEVYGAGELTFFPYQAGSGLPELFGAFPECVVPNRDEIARKLGRGYRELLAGKRTDQGQVVDKMPYNFLYLGLIAACLPEARVIHCQRDPMATLFSLYANDLFGSHPYSYAQEDLVSAYRGYVRLMRHWHDVLPCPILEVGYEDLVNEVGAEARRMTEFLMLPWSPHCADAHRSTRAVVTASQWQVRQPVYRAALDHWRHYGAHLAALSDGLSKTP